MEIDHTHIDVRGTRLHVAMCGPEGGAPIVLLHGFPEYWGAWQVHMGLLARQGYRVIAPDQRGYGTSDKPDRVKDYTLGLLVSDIVGLLDALSIPRARIVGHDWGAAVGWQIALTHPDRVLQLVSINCPPLDVVRRTAISSPMQILRSWYVGFFQLPWLPEQAMSLGGHAALVRTMVGSSVPGTFSRESLAGHLEAWSQPGALRSMIHWYRASARHPPSGGTRVTVPCLFLWGEQDRFLGTALIEPTAEICDDIRVVRFPEATHWLPHEQPETVCREMLEFFEQPARTEDGTFRTHAEPSE